MRTGFAIPILAAALAMAGSAQATVTSYTDASAFAAAAGSVTVETFGTAPTGQFGTGMTFGPVAFTGFSVSGAPNDNYVGIATGTIANAGDDSAIPAVFAGQKFLGWGNGAGVSIGSITFHFNAPTTAFGFDWFNADGSDKYAVQLPTGETYSDPPFIAPSSAEFFGLISTTPFTNITIVQTTASRYISTAGIDNVRVSGIAVPEPAALGLLVAGLLGVFGIRRRA